MKIFMTSVPSSP